MLFVQLKMMFHSCFVLCQIGITHFKGKGMMHFNSVPVNFCAGN
jgi:hypothetical protein